MRSAVAIITYNRVDALKEILKGLTEHCPNVPIGIFEDCGQRDGTEAFLTQKPDLVTLTGTKLDYVERRDLLARKYPADHIGKNVESYLGTTNLGVAGNSNRAIKWFSDLGPDFTHLCLCNDDLHVLGDFVNFYAKAHADLEVGMFCFCDFNHPSYQWITVNSRGYRVKLCGRMTGIMMSFTREVIETIGYFDARFGKFGQEHCDYQNRARLSKFINLDSQMQMQLDLEMKPELLRHQEIETSFTGPERKLADIEADKMIQQAANRYGYDPVYRPFYLRVPKNAADHVGLGIPVDNLGNYVLVDAPA